MQDKDNHNKFLCFQASRSMIQLAKNFLTILEDLRDNNQISPEEYQRLRSKVLGGANDLARDLLTTIESFKVELKNN